MVLAGHMKQVLLVFAGLVVGALIGFVVASGASYLYEHHAAKSQDDMNDFAAILIFVAMPVFVLCGGWMGHRLSRRE